MWFPLPNEHGRDYSLNKKSSDGEKFRDTIYKIRCSIEIVSLIYLALDEFLGTCVFNVAISPPFPQRYETL